MKTEKSTTGLTTLLLLVHTAPLSKTHLFRPPPPNLIYKALATSRGNAIFGYGTKFPPGVGTIHLAELGFVEKLFTIFTFQTAKIAF